MMALSAGDNISCIKLGRITQQSISMLKNIQKFLNVQFKIEECSDDVYDDSSEEEEATNAEVSANDDSEKP